MLKALRRVLDDMALPAAARSERTRDAAGLAAADPGNERAVAALVTWLFEAQDHSASHDGGVARDFSLIHGWASSYPETTGYIIPTLMQQARRVGPHEARTRALRMADWLVRIQYPEGGFQGGKVDSTPRVPVVFNTGQILLGLAAAQAETGHYREPMCRAADWLVAAQDPDGCWRRYGSPFAGGGERQYDTHVAWGLFEAARLDSTRGWGEAGLRNVRWAIRSMRPNGWLPKCCLSDTTQPLTHTLGYALRGVVEAHRFAPDADLLKAAETIALGLMNAMRPDGFLAARLAEDWSERATYSCLTGTVQVASCWLLLFEATGRTAYLDAARRANAYVRRTIRLDAPSAQRGVKGSFPVQGEYGPYSYLNWAAKFAIDSFTLEASLEGPR